MSQEAARKLLDTVMRHSSEQDRVLADIQAMCTQDEFNAYRLMIGRSMGAMFLDVVQPLIAKYPDLTRPALR